MTISWQKEIDFIQERLIVGVGPTGQLWTVRRWNDQQWTAEGPDGDLRNKRGKVRVFETGLQAMAAAEKAYEAASKT